MDPKFPPELERKILELTSALHPRSMPKLLLVAQRVKTWIQPLLYRVLSIAASDPGLEHTGDNVVPILRHPFADIERLLAFASTPESSSLRENVSHLRFPSSCLPRHVTQLLSACPAAIDVVLPMHTLPGNILTLLQPLPLQRLVVYWRRLFPIEAARQMLSSCAKFTHLTHLEIRDWREHDEPLTGWQGLALIPKLTHIYFHELDWMISVIMLCLQHCKLLEALVIACSTPSHIEMTQKRLESSLPGDPLFLVLPSQPPACARDGEDFWAAADRHVKKRRSGATNDYVAGLENYDSLTFE
ncbi:hypothetical protein B0H16DRAFT_1756818 [Mycena metata]|uniref:Uncharacterized protein n=1 Tax=Mycena metata TaxID=1033252 RepID=A0AAD7K041_9AGAR|nr:hypothetical protein B0H16DRAFT_1756818 [Mycena metata]